MDLEQLERCKKHRCFKIPVQDKLICEICYSEKEHKPLLKDSSIVYLDTNHIDNCFFYLQQDNGKNEFPIPAPFEENIIKTTYKTTNCLICNKPILNKTGNNKYCSSHNKDEKAFYTWLRTNTKRFKTRPHLKIELSFNQWLTFKHQPCFYCGATKNIGIDRKDSSIGYTLENCVSCCYLCNIMKQTLSIDKFLNHIELIFNHSLK